MHEVGRESHGLLSAALGVAWRQSSFDGGPVESVARFLLQVHGVWATVCAVAALLYALIGFWCLAIPVIVGTAAAAMRIEE